MITDCILDRKDGETYNVQDFYSWMIDYENEDIIRVFETKDESKIREVLCNYVERNGFNDEIKDFINSVEWAGDIKPIEWKKYWYVNWNNSRGEGYVDFRIVKVNGRSKEQIEGDMRHVLYENKVDAEYLLAVKYAD